MLTLESFAWSLFLLWLCLNVSHLWILALETFAAVWTLFVQVLSCHAGVCVSTSSARSHRYSTSCNILSWWSSSSATCGHTYSGWCLELFDRLKISNAHILLLVGAIDSLLILNIILLLVHISAGIQWSRWTRGTDLCLGDILSSSWWSHRIARLLVCLLLLNHLTLIHLILRHHVLYFVHLLVLLRVILLFELLIAYRIKLFEYID